MSKRPKFKITCPCCGQQLEVVVGEDSYVEAPCPGCHRALAAKSSKRGVKVNSLAPTPECGAPERGRRTTLRAE